MEKALNTSICALLFFIVFLLGNVNGSPVKINQDTGLTYVGNFKETSEGKAPRPTSERCNTKIDLAIVLDGSGNITPNEFILAKSYLSALASAFTPPNRITLIVYSNKAHVIFNIENTLSPWEIDAQIMGAIQPGGATFTNAGIDGAIAQLNNSPVGVTRKMVVVTSALSSNPQATAVSSQNAKLNGIMGYSVGVGRYDMAELLVIAAGRPENVFTVGNFLELVDQICKF